jgi:hypothetical protein
MGLFARQPAPAVILPIFEQTLAIHFVLLCLTVFAARTNVSGQSAKDFNSTKVAKDTKIGEPRGHRLLENGFFLRAVPLLRGDIHFSVGCGSAALGE